MANDLPEATDCETTCCEEADPTGKCYTTKEAIPVCSELNPASQLQSSDCTRLDNTFDILLQAAITPIVGSEMNLVVCNAAIYTVGSWIEFSDGQAGAKFQITAVNAVEKYIKVRNSCSDGVTAIDGNPSPGSSFVANARFTVIGSPKCKTSTERVDDLEADINEADNLCLENVPDRLDGTESIKILGTVVESDCVEGEAAPCMRKGTTRECTDGSVKLGNFDETPETDKTLKPAFVDVKNRIVSGEVDPDIFKWLLSEEEAVATHTSDPGGQQTYAVNNAPAGATHAIVRIHIDVDDNPAGDIAVSFGNIAPIRTKQSQGESYATTEVSIPIVGGNITYILSATSGGSMDFSGNTQVVLEIVGYEKATII